jgi:hypothetical protein
MNRTVVKTVAVWSLVVLNVALLASFVSRMTKPNIAAAQAGARQGDYIMIPGSVLGGVNDVVYVLDQTNHQLGGMSYDPSTNHLLPIGPARDLDHDFDANTGGAVRRR